MKNAVQLSISNLCLEVTRRCNMACAHCLRGDAQNVDITHEIIDRALENVTDIGSITFTGGEPTLNVEAIRYTLEKCEEEGIFVSSFYVVTNGKTVTPEFLSTMMKWYIFCLEHGGEAEMCGLALSKDQFHEPIPTKNELMLRAFSFFQEDKIHTDLTSTKWVLSEGRAENLGISNQQHDYLPDAYLTMRKDDGTFCISVDDLVYVSAEGNVISGCDWSFEHQKKHQIGTVFDQAGWLEKLGITCFSPCYLEETA